MPIMANFDFDYEKRHAEYYLNLLDALNKQYILGGDRVGEALQGFDREVGQVEAAQRWAYENAEDDDQVAQLLEDFADWGADLLLLRFPPAKLEGWILAALAAAKRLGLRRAECVHHGNLGIVRR